MRGGVEERSQAALPINLTFAKAHFNLGVTYRQHGRKAEARREAERALQLGYAPARELLALNRMRGRGPSDKAGSCALVPGRLHQIVE